MSTRRRYTREEKAEAVGLAMTIGPVRAGRKLGIPARNISAWSHSPEAVVLRLETQAQVADRLWNAVVVGTEEVLKGLRDPNARLSDKARALEVVSQQHALLTGGVTERTETVEPDEPYVTREVRDEFMEVMQAIENATDEELIEHESRAMHLLGVGRNLVTYVPGDQASTVPLRDSIDVVLEEDDAMEGSA